MEPREGWEGFSGEPHKLLKWVRLSSPQNFASQNFARLASSLDEAARKLIYVFRLYSLERA